MRNLKKTLFWLNSKRLILIKPNYLYSKKNSSSDINKKKNPCLTQLNFLYNFKMVFGKNNMAFQQPLQERIFPPHPVFLWYKRQPPYCQYHTTLNQAHLNYTPCIHYFWLHLLCQTLSIGSTYWMLKSLKLFEIGRTKKIRFADCDKDDLVHQCTNPVV